MGNWFCFKEESTPVSLSASRPKHNALLRLLPFHSLTKSDSVPPELHLPDVTRIGDTLYFDDDSPVQMDQGIEVPELNPFELLAKTTRDAYLKLPPLGLERDVGGVHLRPLVQLANGDLYLGQWADREDGLPVRKGKGQLFTTTCELYEGFWSNGQLHYFGRVFYNTGELYEGQFDHGKRSGFGKIEALHQSCYYIGGWKDDMKHGDGYATNKEGYTYRGEYRNDQCSGRGKEKFGLTVYIGEFQSGLRNGNGDLYWPDGRVYSGEWKDDYQTGWGTLTYHDGSVYEGEFVQGRREGFGKRIYKGSTYEGYWYQDVKHGRGYVIKGRSRKLFQFEHGKKLTQVVGDSLSL